MSLLVFRTFSIDVRSLAVLRIILALLVLGDLGYRAGDLVTFYSDDGVLPASLWNQIYPVSLRWSIHLLNGSELYQSLMFLLSIVFALCLLVGFETRVAAILSWLFLSSLHNRNPMVLNGGDTYLRVVLFFSLFLPLGEVLSIDQRRSGKKTFANMASFALLTQIAGIYLFSVMLKSGRQWLPDGTAVYFALSRETVTTHLGSLWRQAPLPVHQLLTYGTLLIEVLGPLFLFIPFHSGRWKILGMGLLALLQLGFMVSIRMLGLFPLVSIGVLSAFLPSEFWDKLLPKINGLGSSLASSDSRLTPAHRNRILFSNVFVFFLIACTLIENVSTIKYFPRPSWLTHMLHFFQLKQYWGMYSPEPSRTDYQYRVLGTVSIGSTLSFRLDGTRSLPSDTVKETYKNSRWRNYIPHLHRESLEIRNTYFHYLCKQIRADRQIPRSAFYIDFFKDEFVNERGGVSRLVNSSQMAHLTCRPW